MKQVKAKRLQVAGVVFFENQKEKKDDSTHSRMASQGTNLFSATGLGVMRIYDSKPGYLVNQIAPEESSS